MKETNPFQNKTDPVVSSLAKLKDVKAVLCFGSYAMGTFDEYSDVDLYVFCEPDIVSVTERQGVFEQIEGLTDLQLNDVSLGWDNQWCPQGDRFQVKRVQFDITYNTGDWISTVVKQVTEQGAASIPELRSRPYTMLGLLENSMILYDPESFLSSLAASLYPYPPRLKERLISENLSILRGGLADLHDYARRGMGNSGFHFHFQRMLEALSTLLFALNEKYDPATKRLEDEYQKLRISPPHFLARYTRLLEGPFNKEGKQRAVKEFEILIQEIERLAGQKA